MTSSPVVAIFNSSDDVVEMLRIALEQAGCVVVNGHIDNIRRGERRIGDLVEDHDPAVILYDLVPPYDRSWRFLEHLRSSPLMQGRRFVVTSTNAQRATEVIGDAAYVYEIVGKPYDLGRIVDAVLAAVAGRDDRLPPEAQRA
jgi:DNA-binding NarL/FixJ family response regulator